MLSNAFILQIVCSGQNTSTLGPLLSSLGMVSLDFQPIQPYKEFYPVILDGKVMGRVHQDDAQPMAEQLRLLKVKGQGQVSLSLVQ